MSEQMISDRREESFSDGACKFALKDKRKGCTMEELRPRGTRRGFIGFCVVMVLIIGVLIWAPWRADAQVEVLPFASCFTWSATVGSPSDVNVNFAITSRAAGCYDGHNWTTKPSWSKSYAEHHFWQFSKWLRTRFDRWSGIGNAPNGTTSVRYVTNVIWAEFKLCPPYVEGICSHVSIGIKHQVWANGQSQYWKLTG